MNNPTTSAYDVALTVAMWFFAVCLAILAVAVVIWLWQRRDLVGEWGDRALTPVVLLLRRWDAYLGGAKPEHQAQHAARELPAAASAPVVSWPQPVSPLDHHEFRHLPNEWADDPELVAYVDRARERLYDKWRSEDPTGALAIGQGVR
jgi:hypothetical protein